MTLKSKYRGKSESKDTGILFITVQWMVKIEDFLDVLITEKFDLTFCSRTRSETMTVKQCVNPSFVFTIQGVSHKYFQSYD